MDIMEIGCIEVEWIEPACGMFYRAFLLAVLNRQDLILDSHCDNFSLKLYGVVYNRRKYERVRGNVIPALWTASLGICCQANVDFPTLLPNTIRKLAAMSHL
jgi:hypothetical protein